MLAFYFCGMCVSLCVFVPSFDRSGIHSIDVIFGSEF